MAEKFDNPLHNILFNRLVEVGRLDPKDLHISTIETIKSISDSDVLKMLKDFGVGPTVAKKEGGIVHMDKGGDALLGKLVENLKNKPKLSSTTETMTDVMDALNVPSDTVTNRPSSRIANILKSSKVERPMGPEIFKVFKDKGIKSAQIREIVNVPNIMDYEDDFDGFNKAMKKYRTTALKGLNDSQIATIKNSGFLSGYAEQMRADILKKGVTVGKDGKVKVKPKYKNAITIKKNKPVISMAFQNKYLDENFDFVFKSKGTATGVNKPNIQSKVYTKIQELADKVKMSAKQKLNLDFTLAQIDKLFQAGQTKKAKAALSALVTLVSKGAFGKIAGAATGPIGTAVVGAPEVVDLAMKGKENIIDPMIIEPAAAKMVEGENMLENFLKGKIPSFKDGGSAESSKNISDENLNMIETVLTDLYKREGREVFDDDKVTRIALALAKAKSISIGDKEVDVDFGGSSEDNINLLIDGINMMQGSALEKAKASDGILTAEEAKDSTKNFIKRGINKLGRMFD
jgi:hypothetical protein|tara:strand:- start:1358 stop:2908 length:1551 start_codon:yes stop_codon:yes gene_type:complete